MEFEDGTVTELSEKEWNRVILAGLLVCRYGSAEDIRSITAESSGAAALSN